jgi:hypothetical protein
MAKSIELHHVRPFTIVGHSFSISKHLPSIGQKHAMLDVLLFMRHAS